MISISPHINFNGNAEEAFTFYQAALGAEITQIKRYKDLQLPGFEVSETEAEKIMHIQLTVGDFSIMGNDVPEILGRTNERENRSKICITVDDKLKADDIFQALSHEGEIEVPLSDSPWGDYFGMWRDKFGIEWMINCVHKK